MIRFSAAPTARYAPQIDKKYMQPKEARGRRFSKKNRRSSTSRLFINSTIIF